MKAFIILAAFCFTCLITYGQNGLITWSESKRLSWNDFTGKANDSSGYDAEVFAEVRYTYKFNSLKDYYFDVHAHLNSNTSWSKSDKQSEDLLKHEQSHFDIAELFARKIRVAFESYNYTENFQAEILEVFNQKKMEYHAMQQQYDEETNHSLNKEKQKEWEIFIYEELTKMKATK